MTVLAAKSIWVRMQYPCVACLSTGQSARASLSTFFDAGGKQSTKLDQPKMGRKLCPKLIIEGPRLTGKTDLALALNDHPRLKGRRKYPYVGGLISAEWSGLSEHGWGESLITFRPENEHDAMAAYAHWAGLFSTLPYYRWIIDRFHISTLVYQSKSRGHAPDFTSLEQILLGLGFHIALLTRTPESFEKARAARLNVSARPSQYHDLQAIIDSSNDYRRTVAASVLPSREFDVTEREPDVVANEVFDWLDQSRAL